MDWVMWVIILILVFAIWGATSSSALLRPMLEVGPVRMDWRDIIALAIVVIVFIALYTHQLSYERALAILGGLLIGKLVFR